MARCGDLAAVEVAVETGGVTCSGRGQGAPDGGLGRDCFKKLLFSQHLVTVCSMHSARLVCGRKMMQTVVMMITLDQILSLMSWVELCSPQKIR